MSIKRVKVPTKFPASTTGENYSSESEDRYTSLDAWIAGHQGKVAEVDDLLELEHIIDAQRRELDELRAQWDAQIEKVEAASRVEGRLGAVAIEKEVGILQALGAKQGDMAASTNAAMLALMKRRNELLEDQNALTERIHRESSSGKGWEWLKAAALVVLGGLLTWLLG